MRVLSFIVSLVFLLFAGCYSSDDSTVLKIDLGLNQNGQLTRGVEAPSGIEKVSVILIELPSDLIEEFSNMPDDGGVLSEQLSMLSNSDYTTLYSAEYFPENNVFSISIDVSPGSNRVLIVGASTGAAPYQGRSIIFEINEGDKKQINVHMFSNPQ